jgi:hypothetical protein
MSWHKFTFPPLTVFNAETIKLFNLFQVAYMQNDKTDATLFLDTKSKQTQIFYITPVASELFPSIVSALGGVSCAEPPLDTLFPILGDSGAPKPLDR